MLEEGLCVDLFGLFWAVFIFVLVSMLLFFSDLLLHAVFVEDVGKHLFTLLMFFTLL